MKYSFVTCSLLFLKKRLPQLKVIFSATRTNCSVLGEKCVLNFIHETVK